jgi:hypothetical protein
VTGEGGPPDRALVRLILAGKGHDGGGWASATEHLRAAVPIPPHSRRRCSCGCGRRATHAGVANGFAMMSGCELEVRRWVRDPMTSGRLS